MGGTVGIRVSSSTFGIGRVKNLISQNKITIVELKKKNGRNQKKKREKKGKVVALEGGAST